MQQIGNKNTNIPKQNAKNERKEKNIIKNGPGYQKIKKISFCILLHINQHQKGKPIQKSTEGPDWQIFKK